MTVNTTVRAQTNAPAVTEQLAKFVINHPSRGWDEEVEAQATRTFMNWLGCAVGASRHATVDAALGAVNMLMPSQQAAVLGRNVRVDIASAALINGISSHTFDFDDTHLKTIIHPAGPVASALLALGEHTHASGRELLDALVLGIDVACRVGNAMYPDHYDRGWHITGTTGMLGAAAACARMLKLDAHKTQMAIGIAASQPVGLREQFGTMTKPLHPGAAARAGLMSALMAQHGYTASLRALEAPRGLMQTISDKCDWNEISGELGTRFEISFNSYKPFACGIVIHPSIDACVTLTQQHNIDPSAIERIELKVHPLVLELTGKKTPKDGLQAKFSVFHSCAAGIIFGQAGEHQYEDEIVQRADVIALRDRINATVVNTIDEASVDATIHLKNGTQHHLFLEHAIGSLQRPMTNPLLEKKFHNLVDPVLGAARADSLIAQAWSFATTKDVGEIARATQG
jgi:2-methylcitrate dehydratase PrpD